MATETHELVNLHVPPLVDKALRKIGKGKDATAKYARTVLPYGQAKVLLEIDTKEITRCPDASFKRVGDKFPVMIIEVAYSETKEHMQDKTKTYVNGSKGNVRILIEIDLDYPKVLAPSVSLWLTRYEEIPGTDKDIIKIDKKVEHQVRITHVSININ